MNCEWLKEAAAFNCVPVRGLHGENGIEIGTPFSFVDGTAIVLYAMEENRHILLSDNGETLAHLSSIGLEPHKGRRVQLLRDRISPFGLTLTEKGDVRAVVPHEQWQYMLAQTISAILSVADWEREQIGVAEDIRSVADDAEVLLREWKPNSILERRPKIKGQSKREHSFHYLLDNEYIDVITPNHTATGAAMRKAGDIKNSPYLDGRTIRVIVDDRQDHTRAEGERQILGSLVKAMLFSKLADLAERHQIKH